MSERGLMLLLLLRLERGLMLLLLRLERGLMLLLLRLERGLMLLLMLLRLERLLLPGLALAQIPAGPHARAHRRQPVPLSGFLLPM